MEDVFRSFWWLIFPIGFFIYGAWDRWLAYRRSRDRLELLKAYAVQGKEPPAELLRGMEAEEDDLRDFWGDAGHRNLPRDRRDDIRAALFTGAISVAFLLASEFSGLDGAEGAFRLVSLILGFITVALVLSGLITRRWRDK